MNTKTLLLAAAATLMTLPVAAQESQLSAPIRIVGARQVQKVCHSMTGRAPQLSRAEVASGFNRAWTVQMEPVRAKANSEAREVCMDGNEGVSFTFVRGASDRDYTITSGTDRTVAAATP